MSSELSYSVERSHKDEESTRPDVPILTLGESSELEPTETQERPAVRRAKLAFSRAFPRTYRTTSKALLYLRGPRPKRDLDRTFCLVTPINSIYLIHIPFVICSTDPLPIFDLVLQSSNVVAPFRTGMDPVHTVFHPPASLYPRRHRVHHRPRTLHSSAVVSNTSRHAYRMYRHLLAGQQRVRLGRKGLSTLGVRDIRF